MSSKEKGHELGSTETGLAFLSSPFRCEYIELAYHDIDCHGAPLLVPFSWLITTPEAVIGAKIKDITGEMDLPQHVGNAVDFATERLTDLVCAPDRPNCSDAEIVAGATGGHSVVTIFAAEVLELNFIDVILTMNGKSLALVASFLESRKRKSQPMENILKELAGEPLNNFKRNRVSAQ